jgi:hypothetical protein
MIKILSVSVFAFGLALLAGNAAAADELRIQSEAQFQRDHAGSIERIASGVYLITEGRLAGKTVAFGEAGLDYDIAVLRERARGPVGNRAARGKLLEQVRMLERARAQQAEFRANLQRSTGAKATSFGVISCWYHDPFTNQSYAYFGDATVRAVAEHYLNDGNGFSYYYDYYGRAMATASANVSLPPGVPFGAQSLSANSYVHNRRSGQTISRTFTGATTTATATGYIYSGPTLMHDLYAFSSVLASGSCSGYVSISDRLI